MIKITTPRGLHIRPSKILYHVIRQIPTAVTIVKKTKKRTIRSMLDILMLEVNQGESIAFEFDEAVDEKWHDKLRQIVYVINNYQY